jgi:hypothetical protein
MKPLGKYDDPRRLLIHAGLYLWRQWRLYELEAWQDSMSILHRLRVQVEEEDDALFLETLDDLLEDPSSSLMPAEQELVA